MDFLAAKRNQIDKIDNKIVGLIEKRWKIVNEIVKWKKNRNMEIEDLKREKEIKERFNNRPLPEGLINNLFGLLFKEAKRF